jgi:hypothetical protein
MYFMSTAGHALFKNKVYREILMELQVLPVTNIIWHYLKKLYRKCLKK